ncbi:MAG: alanine--tRNA ligase [Verrucomicrobium sp.]|nr:alanine--tRNA ligase [Verrucomicrobium sp.]
MTSAQLRNSFLEFFREKDHAIVASSSLMPDAPNLLFTNAGMNQFVPIFLGQAECPFTPPRAADTQKCIRAGGKHNDLEDVGLDTYHHTFFEMLGNWSFGNYFKAEAIAWAWELLVDRWKFPPERLYATVYKPGEGDPAEFDQEAYHLWSRIFTKHGLDPAVHIVYGNKKDNFWMMGETGPCGPCSEIHVDLTPAGDTKGSLVNQGHASCIEIWNLVFIQYNATADGGFVELPARHVDTGMGFERACSVVQCTDNFRVFDPKKISNYATDVFHPYFEALKELSRRSYHGTMPKPGTAGETEQEKMDVAFRVIADHIRTLSLAIADGIIPSNEGRGYVLRRILRRAVRYGRVLGLTEPFLHSLVPVVARSLGEVFPEVDRQIALVARVIRGEEESFFKTIDRGLGTFEQMAAATRAAGKSVLSGPDAFQLYDTYGFPLDLTQLMARESGLTIDEAGFESLMEAQRSRSQAAQKKEAVVVQSGSVAKIPATLFVGYDALEAQATLLHREGTAVIVDQTPFYAEMGGQVGDQGELILGEETFRVEDTVRTPAGHYLHKLAAEEEALGGLQPGAVVTLRVDETRRTRISRHHSATHLLHEALRHVLGGGVGQKGSHVGPNGLRFDFSFPKALTNEELAAVQARLNEHIEGGAPIATTERPYKEVKNDSSILQFFNDKYGEKVRVVDIGGYSKELCGGTHAQSAGEIGFCKVILESGIAAGVRRIEAVAGQALTEHVEAEAPKQDERWKQLRAKKANIEALPAFKTVADPHDNWRQLLARQEQLAILEADVLRWEKEETARIAAHYKNAAERQSEELIARAQDRRGIPTIIEDCGEQHPDYLIHLVEAVKKRWNGVLIIAAHYQGKASVAVNVADSYRQYINAATLIEGIMPIVNGRGGGKPSFARGSGSAPEKVPDALRKASELF